MWMIAEHIYISNLKKINSIIISFDLYGHRFNVPLMHDIQPRRKRVCKNAENRGRPFDVVRLQTLSKLSAQTGGSK